MAKTGFLLALFLLAHVSGNLLILFSPEAFNNYAHTLTSNKALLYTAEAGLIALVIAHICVAILLTIKNKQARPQAYAVKTNTGLSRRRLYSSYMIVSGTFIVFFIVYHLLQFKFGDEYSTIQNGTAMRDLARLVFQEFKEPVEVAIYVVAMILIGAHLLHGFRSAFATVGAETEKTSCLINRITKIYIVIVFGGFLVIPLWIFIQSLGEG